MTKDLSIRILQYQKILIRQPFSDCENFRYYFQELIEDIVLHPRNYDLVSMLGKYVNALTARLYRLLTAKTPKIAMIGGVYRFLASVGYTHAVYVTLCSVEKRNPGTVADTLLSSTYSSYISKNLQTTADLFYGFYEKTLVDIESAPPACLEHVLEEVLQFQEIANCFVLMPELQIYCENIQEILVKQIHFLSFENLKLEELYALKEVMDVGLDKNLFGKEKETVYHCRQMVISFIGLDEQKRDEL